MGRHKSVSLTPTIADEVTRLDLREHLEQLSRAHVAVAEATQLERELVARVLMEGGSWDDIATATGMPRRACRKQWSAAPAGSHDVRATTRVLRNRPPAKATPAPDIKTGG